MENQKLSVATNYVDNDLFKMVIHLADIYIADSIKQGNYSMHRTYHSYTCKCGESNAMFLEDCKKGIMDVWVDCGSCAEWEKQEESKFFW